MEYYEEKMDLLKSEVAVVRARNEALDKSKRDVKDITKGQDALL